MLTAYPVTTPNHQNDMASLAAGFGLSGEGRFMVSNLCPSEFKGRRQMKI